MSSPSSSRPARMQAVLDATVTALTEHGYTALTIDRVATYAHASKATIYKSWPTKTDLVCAVAASVRTVPIPTPALGVGLADALADVAVAVRSVTLGTTGRLLLALHEASRAEPRIAATVDAHLVRPQQAAIATVIESMRGQSRIAGHADAAVASRVIASLVIDRALVSGEPLSDEELHRIVSEWLVPALTPRAVSGRTLGPTAGPG